MSAFTRATAEAYVITAMEAGTYIQGHLARDADGTIIVRMQEFQDFSDADGAGDWIEISDDS